ncbi:SsrA-binding protein SmpB [Candidatus Dojkabacteria bacterium]|uniref:SsrA-binding protein n=1 Tax=Candidatus Dojkabacteria bacterium TaxID=2099670 RepID=A0A955I788_9BACT|nr:SsrA-binding protein SmpB [Candidatus Dojkabacteria bacterium]
MKQIYYNKRAKVDYQILDKLEAGIVLFGWEAKSVKAGHVNMTAAYVDTMLGTSLELRGASISSWDSGRMQSDTQKKRDRRLLVHKSQAAKFAQLADRPGYTIIPLSLFVNDKGLIKLEIAVAKGVKKYQKKQKIKERDMRRQLESDMKRL